MHSRRVVERVIGLLAVVAVLAIIIGSMAGQPVLLSYTTSESMAPTISEGDGYVVVPAQLTRISEGDVIVFRAKELHGGGLTVHRTVGETDRGYITKGDANPVTDQATGEPPVRDAQIVGQALQLSGQVVVIPHLGTAITGIHSLLAAIQDRLANILNSPVVLEIQGLAYLFFAATVLLYLVDVRRNRRHSRRTRSYDRQTGLDARVLVGGFTALLVVAVTVSMVLPAGVHQFGIVGAEFSSPEKSVIPKGTATNLSVSVSNSGVTPVIVFLEPGSEGIAVHSESYRVASHSQVNATVTLTVPPRTGYYRRYLVEHRYIALLPYSLIRALYRIHPWLPIVAIDAIIGIPYYLVGIHLIGTQSIRNRARGKPVGVRVRRFIRQFY